MNKKYRYYATPVSSYGNEHGYVDYRTFANEIDRQGGYLRCNNITSVIPIESFYETLHNDIVEYYVDDNGYYIYEYDEEFNPNDDTEIEYSYSEVYQWYLVADNPYTREMLEQANQVWGYIEELDLLVWGVTHWGTSWDYVLTDIKLSEESKGVYING